jgi:hypothetical protein
MVDDGLKLFRSAQVGPEGTEAMGSRTEVDGVEGDRNTHGEAEDGEVDCAYAVALEVEVGRGVLDDVGGWKEGLKLLQSADDAQEGEEGGRARPIQALAVASCGHVLALEAADDQPLCFGTSTSSDQMRGGDGGDILGECSEHSVGVARIQQVGVLGGEVADSLLGYELGIGVDIAVEVPADPEAVGQAHLQTCC